MVKLIFTSLKAKLLICFGVWLVFAALAVAVGVRFTDWLSYRRLSDGIGVYGRVDAKEPANHQIVRYSFLLGRQKFEGIGHGGRGNPSFKELEVGEPVVVFYDPSNPNMSCMGYPEAHQRVEMAGIIFLVLFLPLGPLVVAIIIMVVLSKSMSLDNKRLQRTRLNATVIE
jgi:hypothetical protein